MRYVHSVVVATALLLLACSEQSDNELPFKPQAAMPTQAVREHAAKGFSAVIPEARLRQLQNDPRSGLIEADGPVPDPIAQR